MNEVIRFINMFTSSCEKQEVVEIFNGRCSYWFASVLFRRFIREGATIMFDKKSNHFGTRIQSKVYDITGDVSTKYTWVSWLDFKDKSKQEIVDTYIMF